MKKIVNIIYILVFIFIILCVVYCASNNEYFIGSVNASSDKQIEIVIARYNEDLDFLKESKFQEYPIIVYNKGNNDDFFKPPNLKKIVKLENVGVCDHTYIYHIIENYDNLADVTIFLPGSCSDSHKINKTNYVLEETIHTKDTVLQSYSPDPNLYHFKLDDWLSTNEKNKTINNESSLRPCDIRPYGKWFEHVFPELNITEHSPTYFGIFSISKKHIQNRTKEFYQKYIQYMNKHKNEESAHYVERSYHALFRPSY